MPSRIPLRLRLTLAFAGVMALVLAVASILLRERAGRDLDASISQSLHARAADVGALAAKIERGRAIGGESL